MDLGLEFEEVLRLTWNEQELLDKSDEALLLRLRKTKDESYGIPFTIDKIPEELRTKMINKDIFPRIVDPYGEEMAIDLKDMVL